MRARERRAGKRDEAQGGYGYLVLGAPRTVTVSATVDF